MRKLSLALCTVVALLGAAAVVQATPTTIAGINKRIDRVLRIVRDVRSNEEKNADADRTLRLDVAAANADRRREIQETNGRMNVLEIRERERHAGTTEEDNIADVPADSKRSVAASCPPERVASSGGYEFNTNQGVGTPQPSIAGERIEGVDTYRVTINNLGRSAPVRLRVFVNCGAR